MRGFHDLDSHPLKGIVACLIGYFFIALMGILKKSIAVPLPLAQIIFFQSAICLIMLLPSAIRKGINPIHSGTFFTYIIRILSGLACLFTLFYIIHFMPISQAFLYQYSASLWVPSISLIWLGIRMPKNLWFGIICGFVGILFILKPNHGHLNFVAFMGIICGILQGISGVAIRKLSRTESIQSIMFYYFLVSVFITGIWSLIGWQSLDRHTLLMLIAIGVVTYYSQKLITLALQYASPITLAPICYSSLLFSGLLAWIFWHELPDTLSLIGMALVISGCLMTVYASSLNYRLQKQRLVIPG